MWRLLLLLLLLLPLLLLLAIMQCPRMVLLCRFLVTITVLAVLALPHRIFASFGLRSLILVLFVVPFLFHLARVRVLRQRLRLLYRTTRRARVQCVL